MINVLAAYDTKSENVSNIINNLKQYIENSGKEMKIYLKSTSKSKYDIYLILTNSIEEIKKYKEKYKFKDNVIILTNKLNKEYIMECIKYSENVGFLNSTDKVICDRIEKVYEKNKKE